MENKITKDIPEEEKKKAVLPEFSQLKKLKFCKVKYKTKRGFERDWVNKPYTYDEIIEHRAEQTNWGVLCGYEGLNVVDCDDPELEKAVKENLPATFEVKTGSGGKHFYFICKENQNRIVLQNKKKHYGEVQSYKQQVVAPGSIHPSGNIYKVEQDRKIAKISKEELLKALTPFMKEVKEQEEKAVKEIKSYGKSDINNIPITNVMDTSGFKKSASGELFGANKYHGSSTGMNTWINPTKNVAYCFRCNAGINVAKAIGLEEGIINNCDEDLDKEKFKEVLKIAQEKHGLEKPEGDIKVDQLINGLENEEDVRIVNISGKLHDGVFFQTIPVKYKGKWFFVVITEKGEILKIKNRFEELKGQLKEDEKEADIPDEEKYFYFKYKDLTYKFSKCLFFKDEFKINIPSKNVFKLIKKNINRKQLYEKLLKKFKEFYDHSNPVEYEILLTAVIITYVQWGLGTTFYVITKGREDTGKSTLQKLLKHLQNFGWFGGKSSVPFSARLLHFFGIALNQDEFEKMSKEEKQITIGVFNSGLDVEGTYNFVNTNKKEIKDQLTLLNTFGTKSFSTNTQQLNRTFDKSFVSRCYEHNSTRKNRETKNIINIPEKEKQEFQEITDELFTYCLINYSKIEKDIKDIEKELESEGDFGRKTDVNSKILGILKHFKGDISKEKEELKQKEGLSRRENLTTKESLAFEFLAQELINKTKAEQTFNISNKELKEFLDNKLKLPADKLISPRTVGAILRNTNLVRREDQIKREGDGFHYYISVSDLVDQAQRFGYKEALETINKKIEPEKKSRDFGSLPSFSSFSSFENEGNEGNELNEPKSGAKNKGSNFFYNKEKTPNSHDLKQKLDQEVNEKGEPNDT